MEEDNIIKELKIAYRKLKAYVYNENFSLTLRIKLAEFESNSIEKKLKILAGKVLQFNNDKTVFNEWLNEIDVNILPKLFEDVRNDDRETAFYYTNQNKKETYVVQKITPFIECSIELHILTIIWCMRIGHLLDAKLADCCYGNRLIRDGEKQFSNENIKLFGKYYIKYNEWRDEAIKKAKGLHKLNLDVAILNLDIESYYNSVDFNFNMIKQKGNNQIFNEILELIHKSYQNVLERNKIIEKNGNRILPIGLISSNLLSNYYLKDLDKYFLNQVKPAFYGRYVDDILVVFSNPIINTSDGEPADLFIKRYVCTTTDEKRNSKNVQIIPAKEGKFEIIIENNILKFQLTKVKLYHFLASESISLLEEFEKEIKENSSEFRFQPESDKVFDDFESSSYSITYSDTINKLRSVEGLSHNKLGASKHLSKLIAGTKFTQKLDDSKFNLIYEKIRTFFSGKRGLELNSLWEKVFTFLVINEAKEELISFARELMEDIFRIKIFNKEGQLNVETTTEIITNLIFHMGNCFSMAAALNKSFFNSSVIDSMKTISLKSSQSRVLKELTFNYIKKNSDYLIKANLFRHYYTYYPLLNYCKQLNSFSFINKFLGSKARFNFDEKKVEYSPRFIHYHEIALFYNLRHWFSKEPPLAEFKDNPNEFLLKKYIELNNLKSQLPSYERNFPFSVKEKLELGDYREINVYKSKKRYKLKLGIVNISINKANSLDCLMNKPNLSFERLDEIRQVLNDSLKNKCDVLIFPEISIPIHWLSILSDFSRKNGIAIICGIEHFKNFKNEALNYVVTILPFTYNSYSNSLVDFRLKINYSPDEIDEITSMKLKVPSHHPEQELKLYIWQNIYFTVLNCFEITDINKRAVFRGKIDFAITVEYNRDINYFSNITESIARDIHAYIVQVNTSHFGDSRITQPAETYNMDIVKIKGGENIILMTSTIDLKKLRLFHSRNYSGQRKLGTFKLTPPNFNPLKKRIKNS